MVEAYCKSLQLVVWLANSLFAVWNEGKSCSQIAVSEDYSRDPKQRPQLLACILFSLLSCLVIKLPSAYCRRTNEAIAISDEKINVKSCEVESHNGWTSKICMNRPSGKSSPKNPTHRFQECLQLERSPVSQKEMIKRTKKSILAIIAKIRLK